MANEEQLAKELERITTEIREAVSQRHVPSLELYSRQLELQRELGRIRGTEFAERVDEPRLRVGFEWHVTAGFAQDTILACDLVNPDERGRSVLFRFRSVIETRFGGLNDELLDEHPLFGKGLDVVGFYIVRNSSWKESMGKAMSHHSGFDSTAWSDLNHYLFRDKGGELGCLAKGFDWKVSTASIKEICDRLRDVSGPL
jgi:hypothetical protein